MIARVFILPITFKSSDNIEAAGLDRENGAEKLSSLSSLDASEIIGFAASLLFFGSVSLVLENILFSPNVFHWIYWFAVSSNFVM